MDAELLSIGKIASFFDVSVKAIRVYEKMGILIPAKIDPDTGYRYYTVDQVQTLNALLDLKRVGFSLNEIKKIMSGEVDNAKFVEALQQKRIAWQETIFLSESKIDIIDKIGQRIAVTKESSKLHELTEEERARLLVKIVCIEDLSERNVISEAIWL